MEPSEDQLQAYAIIERLVQLLIELLRPGAILGDLYRIAKAKVQCVRPDLLPRLTRRMGYLVGLEDLDTLSFIQEGSQREVQLGDTFVIFVGLAANEVEAPHKPWGMCLGQTVLVRAEGPAQILTSSIASQLEYAVGVFDAPSADVSFAILRARQEALQAP
jgi:nucleosome binding factor SPN SPT16 subunit